MGISKKELLSEYYFDEIGEIIHEYNELHRYGRQETHEVSCEDFFGF